MSSSSIVCLPYGIQEFIAQRLQEVVECARGANTAVIAMIFALGMLETQRIFALDFISVSKFYAFDTFVSPRRIVDAASNLRKNAHHTNFFTQSLKLGLPADQWSAVGARRAEKGRLRQKQGKPPAASKTGIS